jgi:hypothetical protein
MENENDEIGRELTVAELQPNQLVVIRPPGRRFYITAWVEAIDPKTVTFYLGDLKLYIVNLIVDNRIIDDQSRQVHIFEYLGTP